MSNLALVLIVLVAALHLFFLVLEMFLWTRPYGMKVFRQSRAQAEQSKVLAANQGLYNGFLAAGLVWAAATAQRDVALFFLGCVVVAGLYGAATVNRRIFLVQALPALVALGAVLLHG
jgi:putative membrane protein